MWRWKNKACTGGRFDLISNWGQGRGRLSMAPTVSAEVEGAACDSAEVTGLARVDTRKEGKEGP